MIDEYGLIMTGNDLKSLQSMGFYNPDPAYSQYVSRFGTYFASKLTHEIYDYSGLGLIRNDHSLMGWKPDNNYQDHLAIDRLFGTNITVRNEFRSSCGMQFSDGMLPCPGSLTSIANRVVTPSRQTFRDLKSIERLGSNANLTKEINGSTPIWSSTRNKTSIENAYRHWKDHGHAQRLFLSNKNTEKNWCLLNFADPISVSVTVGAG